MHERPDPPGPPARARAPRWVTILNPVARFLLAARVPLGANALMTVRGRKSGLSRTTPLAIIRIGGRRWIWAPWGEVDWVRNLREAGHATITIRGRPEDVTASELDDAQRAAFFREILAPYARRLPLGISLVRLVDQTDLRDPEGAAAGRVVFELHPAT